MSILPSRTVPVINPANQRAAILQAVAGLGVKSDIVERDIKIAALFTREELSVGGEVKFALSIYLRDSYFKDAEEEGVSAMQMANSTNPRLCVAFCARLIRR